MRGELKFTENASAIRGTMDTNGFAEIGKEGEARKTEERERERIRRWHERGPRVICRVGNFPRGR